MNHKADLMVYNRIRTPPRHLIPPPNLHRRSPSSPRLPTNQQQAPFPALRAVKGPLPSRVSVDRVSLPDQARQMAPRSEPPVDSFPSHRVCGVLPAPDVPGHRLA